MSKLLEVSMEEFKASVTSHTKPHDSKDLAICDWAIGLGGESGEVVEAFEKFLVSHGPKEIDARMELLKEVGDILWYDTMLATELGIELPIENIHSKVVDAVSSSEQLLHQIVVHAAKVQECVKHRVMHKEAIDPIKLQALLVRIFDLANDFTSQTLNVPLAVAVQLNMRKLAHRFGKSYSVQASQNRHEREAAFQATEEFQEILAYVERASL